MKRICSMALAIIMMFTMIPMSVFASSVQDSIEKANFTVVDDDESTLAPGVTMNEMVLYNSNNQRVEMYVTTVDTTVDTVEVKANYMDNQNAKFGMQTLSDQVAAMEANYEEPFKIVAGINASYYNTTTGQPTGAFVMEGIDASANGDNYAFFAVLKDGTYMIGAKGEYSTYKDQLQEAIGGYQHIVKDGAVANGLDKTALYPRQTLGLTEDGKLILMTADGSQAPTTVGVTIQEQAEIMLALGCVEAIHLDGGNSATFGAIREGTDKFVTVNSPSGGGERQVSNTLMIISTAVPSGTFDHAVITSDYEYFSPYSQYTFDAFGVDATNANAEIPESVVWDLSDDTFGVISEGTFISSGKYGSVDIQMVDNGEVVGTKTIEIVDPTTIAFETSEVTIPYGKTAELKINAMYGNYSMFVMADSFDWNVDPITAGTLDGYDFTADEYTTDKTANVTATYKYDADVESTIISIKFGKGSEVLFDFEDGDISDWRGTDTISEWTDIEKEKYPDTKHPIVDLKDFNNGVATQRSSVFLASKENGDKVKSGDYALGVDLDRLNADGVGAWLYNYIFYTGDTQVWRDVVNGKSAVRVGMWVNLSQEASNTAFRICRTFDDKGVKKSDAQYMTSDYDGKKVSYNTDYAIPESGWIYMYFDLTAYDYQASLEYNPDECYAENYRADKGHNISMYPAFIQFINGDKNDTMARNIIYIDDITLDYSEVTEDRDAPIISDMQVCHDTANFVELNGQTVNNNLLSFTAKVTDDSGNSNATGLDYDTAKILIDGIDVSNKSSFKAASRTISLNDVYLTDGKHTVSFEICDKQGNETRETKTIVVNGTAGNVIISIEGHNEGKHAPKAGSVYYLDVKASDAEKVEAVTTTLLLNTANKFEYEHIICAEGVTVEATEDQVDNELTLVIKHDGTLSGEAVLASVPVRVWSWDEEATGISSSKQFSTGSIPVIDIICKSLYGEVICKVEDYSDYVCGFYDEMVVKTELDNKTNWHVHNEVNTPDVDATCTESGYKNRMYCEECASVVDWGEIIEALGHDWEVNEDGKLACSNNGELYNGVYTDGKTYVDGIVVADGWIEVDGVKTYYYMDGIKLTGSHLINDVMCTFDENGVYKSDYKYDGWYEIDDTVMYFVNNEYVTGYMSMKQTPYYFDESGRGLDGEYTFDDEVCIFNDGEFESSVSGNLVLAGWIGTSAYFTISKDGTIQILGNGTTYQLEHVNNLPWSAMREELTKVYIGKNIKTLPKFGFSMCHGVTEVVFEEGSQLEIVSYQAFKSLYKVKKIVLPETVKKIEWCALGYMDNLESIYIPSSVTNIHPDTFMNTNKKLTFVVVDGSYAHSYAINKGYNVEIVPYKPVVIGSGECGENAVWKMYTDGTLMISGEGALNDYTYHKYGETAAPWTAYREEIKKLIIGKDITEIGAFSFYSCGELTEVEFEEGSKLAKIGKGAFGYNAKLENILLPSSLLRIESSAFYYCTSLKDVMFEEASRLETIGVYAFQGDIALQNLYVPETVNSIGKNFIDKCDNVKLLVVAGSYAHDYALANDHKIEICISVKDSGMCGENVTWEMYTDGTLIISGKGAIEDYTYHKYGETAAPWTTYREEIKKLIVGRDITEIGEFNFYLCSELTEVEFEEGSKLAKIGKGAFGYSAKLENILLPSSLLRIESSAFYYCTSLKDVMFEEGSRLESIGVYAFQGNSALQTVYIPETVDSIGKKILDKCNDAKLLVSEKSYAHEYALANDYNYLTRSSVKDSGMCGENVTWEMYTDGTLMISGEGAIEDYTYHKYGETAAPWTIYREEIKKLVIGKDITEIGEFNFYLCSELTEVEFEEGSKVTRIGKGAFGYSAKLENILLPSSLLRIESSAFYYCTSLKDVMFEEGSRLEIIGVYAFQGDTALQTVYIPETVDSIGKKILDKCNDAKLLVVEGSYAHEYAKQNLYEVEVR